MNGELEFAKVGATWLLTWSWQALLLLGVVWLMLKLSRVKAPVVRHQLWLVGLLAVAALPLCSFVASPLDQFEIDLDGNHTVYGVGTLRIQPKANAIESALSSDGAIYLDAMHTQKVGLSEFLR